MKGFAQNVSIFGLPLRRVDVHTAKLTGGNGTGKKTPIQQRTCRPPITELSWNLCLRQFGKRKSTHTNAEKQVNLVQEKFCALIFPQNAAN